MNQCRGRGIRAADCWTVWSQTTRKWLGEGRVFMAVPVLILVE
jgi:hypothetical protein